MKGNMTGRSLFYSCVPQIRRGRRQKTQALFATAYERYGNILYRKGAYALAMDAYLQARKIAEKHSLGGNMASSYARIGNIYASCGDYEGAISFYQKALSREDVKRTTIYTQ